ncbi:hypothetical protein EMCRGX_G017453 [Ephydatia muelleri]
MSQNRRAQPAPLVPLPVMAEPFSRIAMDIVGPLPRSRSGHKYILVICDYATRYPEAVPLRSCEAEKIAEELMKLLSRVGIPKEVLTDQRSNFTSRLLAELYTMLQVKAIRTTPYHSQTDGLVERFNQTLKAMLRRTVNQEGKDWDRLILYLLFAYTRRFPRRQLASHPLNFFMDEKALDVSEEGVGEAGLTAKPSKCHFAMKECTYLGRIIRNGQVRPEIEKLAAFQYPKQRRRSGPFWGSQATIERLQCHPGKCDGHVFWCPEFCYRKFVASYASLAAPLTELTKSKALNNVNRTPHGNQAFKDLKRLLCSSPVLQCPDFSHPFIQHTDASDWGVGAVLSQLDMEDHVTPWRTSVENYCLGKGDTPWLYKEGTMEEGTMEEGTMEEGTMEEGTMEEGTMEEGTMEEGTMEEGTMEEGTMEEGTMEEGTMEEGTMEEGTMEALK